MSASGLSAATGRGACSACAWWVLTLLSLGMWIVGCGRSCWPFTEPPDRPKAVGNNLASFSRGFGFHGPESGSLKSIPRGSAGDRQIIVPGQGLPALDLLLGILGKIWFFTASPLLVMSVLHIIDIFLVLSNVQHHRAACCSSIQCCRHSRHGRVKCAPYCTSHAPAPDLA